MDKKLYLIAELDNNTQDIIKGYYKIILENGLIGTQTKDIPYHITSCSYSLENENNLLELMDKINGKYSEIEILFGGFGLFGLNVLYFNPAMNNNLLELYNYFKDNSYDKNNAFTAHATLLIDEPENIIKILPKITKELKPFAGSIVNTSLYEFFPKRFIKKLELK
jgi:2'-5' RNA ligase